MELMKRLGMSRKAAIGERSSPEQMALIPPPELIAIHTNMQGPSRRRL
jgi:hypothetical protein